MITQVPYPGLRPFERSESDIFFGREEQTDQLLRRLENSHFLAIVGPSGCGKSSLVRAGMMAALEIGYMATAGARWRVATMRPGASPFSRLAAALLDKTALGTERQGHENAEVFLEATLRRGPLGLVEALGETPLPRNTNLLLLVDQFEEIFRFRAAADHDEADAFVALLLQSGAQHDVPIYVVLTMRSDYIGDCAVFTGLPEALNESQYLTPRLTREQRRSAIVGPARVFGGDVEPQLVNRILNEMGPEPELLPVFQHLLMRMWTYDRPGSNHPGPPGTVASEKSGFAAEIAGQSGSCTPSAAAAVMIAEREAKTSGRILTLADYQAVGGFANALSRHANEAFDSLSEKQRQTATLLFRRLCERGGRLRDVRRPTSMRDIMELTHLSQDEVTAVANAFRSPEHNFLAPPFPEPLTPETVLDLTHESLIKQWNRLNDWVDAEDRSARIYRRLEDTASRWKKGKAALWGTPDLDEAIAWQQDECPTAEWARRYGGDFTIALEFLEASRKKRAADEAETKAQQQRKLRRAHWLALGLALTVIALVGGFVTYCYLYVWKYKADYKSFVKVFGEPRGVDQLTSRQVQHRALSTRIIKKGRWGRVIEMQMVNGEGDLTPSNGVGTYLRHAEELSPVHECDWKFTYDSHGRVATETAYNRRGKMVWGFVYSPTQEKNANSRDGYYLGPDGYPSPEKGSAASFVHFEYSADGYERRILYRDRLARSMPGPDKAFGQEHTYDDQGRIIEEKSLDPDGKPMNDEAGNSSMKVTYDGSGDVLTANAYDASGLPAVVTEGWSQRRSKYDENGNEVELSYFDPQGQPVLHKDGYHRLTSMYDDRAYVIEQHYWDESGQAAFLSGGYHATRFSYDSQGNVLQITYLDGVGHPVPNRSGFATVHYRYDGENREVERVFFDANGKPVVSQEGYNKVAFKYDDRGNPTEVAYFESDGLPTESVDAYARFTSEYDARNQLIRQALYDHDGNPTLAKGRYATRTFKYDDRGNRTDEAYFGVHGEPTDGGDGHFRWQAAYDERGNAIRIEYFGIDGKPVMLKEGYAGFTSEYDQLGKETKKTYFGLRHEAVRGTNGIAGWTSKYDVLGNETGRAYFDLNGNPAVLTGEGYASYHATFDRGGHRTRLEFFDIHSKPVLNSRGYALTTMKYDTRGDLTEQAYFDTHGRLILAGGEKEYARVIYQDDRNGNQVERTYFGVHNEPIIMKLGYHSEHLTYDSHNHPIEWRFYGVHGEAIETSLHYARSLQHFDKYGNVVDEAIFRLSGAPASEDGCHQHLYRYDERQRRVAETCIGLDGRLALRQDGTAVRTFQYDARGHKVELAYFGAHNEPVRWFGKAQHKEKYTYDNRDHKIREEYFDIDDRPMIGVHKPEAGAAELCTRWTGSYDLAGRLVKSQCAHE